MKPVHERLPEKVDGKVAFNDTDGKGALLLYSQAGGVKRVLVDGNSTDWAIGQRWGTPQRTWLAVNDVSEGPGQPALPYVVINSGRTVRVLDYTMEVTVDLYAQGSVGNKGMWQKRDWYKCDRMALTGTEMEELRTRMGRCLATLREVIELSPQRQAPKQAALDA